MATPPPTASGEAQLEAQYRLWATLSIDILNHISANLTDIPDFINFRAVCNPWRSVAPNRRPFLPLLLLPHDPKSDSLSLLHLPSSRVATARLPETRGKVIVGSSFGWLALVSLADNSISLFNPFTRAQIPLPQLVQPDSPRYNPRGPNAIASLCGAAAAASPDETDSWMAFVLINKGHPWKISLSRNPMEGKPYLVAATLSCAAEFAVLRPDTMKGWVILSSQLPWPNEYVLYNKAKIYVLCHHMFCTVFDLAAGVNGTMKRSDSPESSFKRGTRPHVVKVGGEMMLVVYAKSDKIKREGEEELRVYKLEEGAKEWELKWAEVSSIGEYAIFLSGNQGCAVRAVHGVFREDCIYFSGIYGTRTEGLEPGFHHVDVFDLKERRFERVSFPWASSGEGWHFDTWITPCLC